jgi:hypothetical protein
MEQIQDLKAPTNVVTNITVDLGPRNRLTTFFRLVLALPAIIIVALLSGGSWSGMVTTTYVITLPVILLLLFFGFYPKFMIIFAFALQTFNTKLGSYLLFLRDDYPSFREQSHTYLLYPDVAEGKNLNRWLPLVKWFLAIPHFILLALAIIPIILVWIYTWIYILVTTNYPVKVAPFTYWYVDYNNRVTGYALTLVSDKYPSIK